MKSTIQLVLALTACALSTQLASAQAFNVDCNVPPSVAPPNTYPGYPGSPGEWNALSSSAAAQPLRLLNGSIDPNVTATVTGLVDGPIQSIPAPHTELYQDFFEPAQFQGTIDVEGLDPGEYVVYVYTFSPDRVSQISVSPASTGGTQTLLISNPSTFNGHQLAIDNGASTPPVGTLLQFDATIALNDILTIRLRSGGSETDSVINGFQLLPRSGVVGCVQTNTNFLGFKPDIFASGTQVNGNIVAAANDMVLHVGALPTGTVLPNGGGIVMFASNTFTGPTTIPTVAGELCLGGPFVRVLAGNGGAAPVSAAGTAAVPVDLNYISNSAFFPTGAINVMPGSTIHFQAAYRDVLNMQPIGRWTSSLSVMLQ